MDLAALTTEVVAGVYLAGPPQQRNYTLENPNLPLNDPAIWEAVFNDSYGTDSGVNVTAEKALMYAPFFRAVNLISGDVAKLPRYVYKRRGDISPDARERDRGHRLNYLLNGAWNPETEAIKGWCRFMADALIWSNAWARIYFDGSGQPTELYNLLPDRTCWEYIDGQLFCVTEAGGKLVPLFPWEVLHVEGLRTTGIAKALWQLARNSIALGLAQERFASKFFAHGGRVGGILEVPAGVSKPAFDTLTDGFQKAYEGADNPFKTVILRDSAKFHAAQQSPHDSQMVEATENQTRTMAHWFNLPPSKLGVNDPGGYNTKLEDNQNYLDTTLDIWNVKIDSACNFRLISDRQTDSHFVETSVKNLLRMNPLQQAQMHQVQIASRVINPNEARADLNRLPYEGGDEFVNPNTMKSGNEPGDKKETPGEMPDDMPKEDMPEKMPKRDAAYLRVLFGITARARDKAKRPNAFIEWIDGDLKPHRDEWRHVCGHERWPFTELQICFRSIAEHYPEDQLPLAVDSACKSWEDGTWNAG